MAVSFVRVNEAELYIPWAGLLARLLSPERFIAITM